eukprot:scaffold201807_cov15-Prasinocladus_malaysianus.AAC.1
MKVYPYVAHESKAMADKEVFDALVLQTQLISCSNKVMPIMQVTSDTVICNRHQARLWPTTLACMTLFAGNRIPIEIAMSSTSMLTIMSCNNGFAHPRCKPCSASDRRANFDLRCMLKLETHNDYLYLNNCRNESGHRYQISCRGPIALQNE